MPNAKLPCPNNLSFPVWKCNTGYVQKAVYPTLTLCKLLTLLQSSLEVLIDCCMNNFRKSEDIKVNVTQLFHLHKQELLYIKD